jgi:hypothetical protein
VRDSTRLKCEQRVGRGAAVGETHGDGRWRIGLHINLIDVEESKKLLSGAAGGRLLIQATCRGDRLE